MTTEQDKTILRELAYKIAQYAARPEQDVKRKLWQKHNDLQTNEPVVYIDPENGWNEIIPQSSLQCTDAAARAWERKLRMRLYHAEVLRDDMVIDNVLQVGHVSENDGWGLPTSMIRPEQAGGAYAIRPSLEEYEEDFKKIHFPHYNVKEKESADLLQEAQETFDGLLRVEQYDRWWWSLGLTWWYIDLRGLENFMCDFVTDPDWVHCTLNLLCEGALNWIDELEQKQLLYSNNGNYSVGSGGFGFTGCLPPAGGSVCRSGEMWGFVESQETTAISPEMYGEFIFPYHRRLAERFGLNCYGCCEPFETRWKYVSQLPNLRRVSCSPWSNRAIAAELLGNRYISSCKLPPMPLALPNLDEDEVRRHLRDVLDHTKNCCPELIMKDNNTLGGGPHNAIRWVELAREEIART